MTRINCLPVQTLSDKHLLAEYKEITRPFNKVAKRLQTGTMATVQIPERYVLGKGHETFFFNKLAYLYQRYRQLCAELRRREVNVNMAQFETICAWIERTFQDSAYWQDWTPDPAAMYLNMARLVKRSQFEEAKQEALS